MTLTFESSAREYRVLCRHLETIVVAVIVVAVGNNFQPQDTIPTKHKVCQRQKSSLANDEQRASRSDYFSSCRPLYMRLMC